jgi:NADH-quinone oxidoreductase subunit N
MNLSELYLITPILVISATAILILLLDIISKDSFSKILLSVGSLIVAIAYVPFKAINDPKIIFSNMINVDSIAIIFTVLILFLTLFALFIMAGNYSREGIDMPTEFFCLVLIATSGCLLMVLANTFLIMFLGIELLSLPLYCLVASARKLPNSAEAGLKYFILGSVSSAFFLYGIALCYGITGTTSLKIISDYVNGSDPSNGIWLAIGLCFCGLLFKLGVIPFQSWLPDVYQGAPTIVTTFMATTIKVAATGALLRLVSIGLIPDNSRTLNLFWLVALFTIVIGTFVALRQTNVKRLLAYSSIVNGGYIVIGLLWIRSDFAPLIYFLISYTMVTLGLLIIVGACEKRSILGETEYKANEAKNKFPEFRALAETNPVLAIMVAFLLITLAGLPPSIAGLLAKFLLFKGAILHNFTGLIVVAVICSAISCYYYFNLIVAMYTPYTPNVRFEKVRLGLAGSAILGITIIISIFMGILPSAFFI